MILPSMNAPRPERVRRAASLPPGAPVGLGLSAPEAEIYLAVKKAGKVSTEAEIARDTGYSAVAVSKCVRSLGDKGLVKRNTSGLGGSYFYAGR